MQDAGWKPEPDGRHGADDSAENERVEPTVAVCKEAEEDLSARGRGVAEDDEVCTSDVAISQCPRVGREEVDGCVVGSSLQDGARCLRCEGPTPHDIPIY